MAEKYTQWADRSCGVNPFVPEDTPLPKQFVMKMGRYAAAAVVALPRIGVAAVLASLWVVCQCFLHEIFLLLLSVGLMWLSNAKYFASSAAMSLISLLSCLPFSHLAIIPAVRRRIQRLVISIIPPVLGVSFSSQWANSARVVGIKVSAEEKSKNEKSSPFSVLDSGHLLLSNCTNILEIFFLESCCSSPPIYVFPSCEPAGSGGAGASYNFICHTASFTQALRSSVSYVPFPKRSKSFSENGKPLVVILAEAKKLGSPVILFIEGVQTNGSGILEFNPQILKGFTDDTILHLSGFVYGSSPQTVAPPCPVGSQLSKIFWLSASPAPPVSVTVNCLVNKYGVPKLVLPTKGSSLGTDVTDKRLDAWTQELREIFSKIVNKKLLKLSMIDYDSFYQYYVANTMGNVSESKRISDARGGKK